MMRVKIIAALAAWAVVPCNAADFVDFSKDLWITKGGVACTSQSELAAKFKGAPADCITLPAAMGVIILDSDGVLNPDYHVRFIGIGNEIVDAWCKRSSLTNSPDF